MSTIRDAQDLLIEMGVDRPLAHETLFPHRRADRWGVPVESAPFHAEMCDDWASDHPFVLDMVFRGGAKSTIAEESAAIGALYQEFKYCLIVSYNQDKAIERLAAIRHEFHTNEFIQTLFGRAAALDIDTAKEIVTGAGVKFQALGRGQSLRGLKHLDIRPDMIFIDDAEDRNDISTPEARKKVWDWLTRDLLPAKDPGARVRMAATPLHPECAAERLTRDPDVLVRRIPIYYRDLESGELRASWEGRFPLQMCLNMENSYRSRGELENFKQEYMVQAESPEAKPFKPEMIKIAPRVHTWEATYSMTDPARTVRQGSATTGHVVWSWINNRLIIWEGWGRRLMPDEIVSAMFDSYEALPSVWVGVEEDGLNQFLLQPIRREMVDRGLALPLKAVKAPPGKLDFIRGLQPFFRAGEVEFAKELPDLKEQLLGFPTGDIDVPNALAYALKIRPGQPIYEDFSQRHISDDLQTAHGSTVWLCLNATDAMVSALAVQVLNGTVRVYWDAVREGDAGAAVHDLITAAQVELGRTLKITAGPAHFDRYNNVGLVQALRKVPVSVEPGRAPLAGRAVIRRLLQRERNGRPMILIDQSARWTLNGFSAGYSRALMKGGQLSDLAEEGPYRLLLEGLEAFLGRMEAGSPDSEDDARNYAVTADGRRYVTLLGTRGRGNG